MRFDCIIFPPIDEIDLWHLCDFKNNKTTTSISIMELKKHNTPILLQGSCAPLLDHILLNLLLLHLLQR